MLCLTLSMGCTKKAKTASGDTGSGDAKTAGTGAATDPTAALQKQIEELNGKIAAGIKPVAEDVTKLRTEIENEKKAVLTPVLKQEFLDTLMSKKTARDFATYYFNSIEQYASPEVFSEEKSDFYETLHSDTWPLNFLPNLLERIGRSLDTCTSDYRAGLEWFQTGIPSKTKFEIIKKMTTLLFQDYPSEKLVDIDNVFPTMPAIILDQTFSVHGDIAECTTDLGFYSIHADPSFRHQGLYLGNFTRGDTYDQKGDKTGLTNEIVIREGYDADLAHYIHEFFNPKNNPVVPVGKIQVVGFYDAGETPASGDARAKLVFDALVKELVKQDESLKDVLEIAPSVKGKLTDEAYNRYVRLVVKLPEPAKPAS